MKKQHWNSRSVENTNGLTDVELAEKFYIDKNVPSKFGKTITNEDFNQWILDLGFVDVDHPWETKTEKANWNNYRSTVRRLIKNGVCSDEYAASKKAPYCLEVKKHGKNLIISKFDETVIKAYRDLSEKRIKTLNNQAKTLQKDFDIATNLYSMNDTEAIMSQHLVEAQNKMRLAFETSCGEILQTTVESTLKTLADSRKKIAEATQGLIDLTSNPQHVTQ